MTEAENVTARLMSPLMSGCTGSYFCSPQPRPQPFFTNKQLPSPQPPMGATILSSLFISNIPCKIREEEIVELFKDLPGYVSGRLRRTKVGNYIAFIEFDTAQNAIAARNKYNGYNFDSRTVPANSSTLPKHLIKRHGILIDFSRANASQTQSTQQQQQQQQQQSYLQLGFGEGDTNIANKHFSSLFYSRKKKKKEENRKTHKTFFFSFL